MCTHEVRFEGGVIDRLIEVARERPGGHVIAPRRVTQARNGQAPALWSEGGRLSFPLRHPEHVRVGRTHGTRRALWADGAAFVIAARTWRRVGGIPEERYYSRLDSAVVHAEIYAKTITLALLGERGRARAIENRRAISDARRRVRAAAAGGDQPRPRGRAWRPDRQR